MVPLFNEAVILLEVAREYSPKVFSFTLKLTRSRELAMKVVQDVFMKIRLNREKLEGINTFGAYLNRVNRNHCLNVIKRLSQERKASTMLSQENTEISYDTENELTYRNTREQIEAAISYFSPQQQKVYRLCHIEGLKHEEVARRLHISPGTVHTHMKRAENDQGASPGCGQRYPDRWADGAVPEVVNSNIILTEGFSPGWSMPL